MGEADGVNKRRLTHIVEIKMYNDRYVEVALKEGESDPYTMIELLSAGVEIMSRIARKQFHDYVREVNEEQIKAFGAKEFIDKMKAH
uniref:Uncharacterized protein n=1 Tax=viral metagenome TaxID=1070528 RepID=A0A6M3L1L3_9ZZZZ